MMFKQPRGRHTSLCLSDLRAFLQTLADNDAVCDLVCNGDFSGFGTHLRRGCMAQLRRNMPTEVVRELYVVNGKLRGSW